MDQVLAGMGYAGGPTEPEAMRALVARITTAVRPLLGTLTSGAAVSGLTLLGFSFLIARSVYDRRDI